jgi:hypothetical protein
MNLKFQKLAQQILSEGRFEPTGSGQNPFNSQSYRKSQGADYDQNVKETNRIRITTKEGKKKFYSVNGAVKTYPGTRAGMDQANAACKRLKAQAWVSDAVVVSG